ncbi:MAG: hypothetical protein IT427_10235 [Pirellulales bacterium]|nr:hypothetical protein [Pirellulales bacterium]
MKSTVVLGVIGFGILLLILSALWNALFPATTKWTPEKAARAAEVKGKLHNLAFIVNSPRPNLQAGQDLGQLKAEYDALRKENQQLDAEFSSAAETPHTVSKVLKWSGISLAAIGIIGWYAINQQR